MKKTLKQHVMSKHTEYSTEEYLYECFEEWEMTHVVDTYRDKHRWYTDVEAVCSVVIDNEIRYFNFTYMEVEGDSSRDDCGWVDPDLDDLVEVYPKEVKTISYVTEDKL